MADNQQPGTAYHLTRSKRLILACGALITCLIWWVLQPASDPSDGLALTPEARHLAVVFALIITLWISEVIPIAVASLAIVPLLVVAGITETRAAITGFASPVFMFVLSMFILAAVIRRAGLDRTLASFLLARAGSHPHRILLAFMTATATLSTIISDVPACAVFMTMGLELLKRLGVQPRDSRFGRALMMGVPIAALIGGVATPAGSSVNVLGIQQITDFADKHQLDLQITFLQWSAIGIPMVLVLIPLAWWILVCCCPAEESAIQAAKSVQLDPSPAQKLDASQIMTLALLGVMLSLWIAGSWVRWLDVTVVAMLGAIIVFLPGIRLITWSEAQAAISWETLLMIGGVVVLGKASLSTGLAETLVTGTIDGIQNWNLITIIAFVSTITVLIHLPLPIAPVVNVVLIPPVAALALDPVSGQAIHNPIWFALPVAFMASCAFLLPLDAVCLLTYSKRYYRMHDMLLPGSLISVCWVIIMTVVMLVMAPLVGLV